MKFQTEFFKALIFKNARYITVIRYIRIKILILGTPFVLHIEYKRIGRSAEELLLENPW